MLSLFRCLRESGWKAITADEYKSAWMRFGGSVITHPDVVEKLSCLAGIAPRYLGWMDGWMIRAEYVNLF